MEEKKKWFGRGIYDKKDAPIRILDKLILGAVALVIILIFWFAVHGGYTVSFDTDGGSEVAEQRLEYGDLVAEPETPVKPGYTFVSWVTSRDESLAEEWSFAETKVTSDQTLYAVWEPAQVTVKFDLDGGACEGSASVPDKTVVYGETYGELPAPEKEGCRFDGWVYSGNIITADTQVTMTGEHVLTARWVMEEN